MSGRDYHSLHRQNDSYNFHASVQGGNVAWKPHPNLPAVTALTNGVYRDEPEWFRNFLYDDERERGLDHVEDLASPGVLTWDLSVGSAVMVLRAGDALNVRTGLRRSHRSRTQLQRRESARTPWDLAADSYIVDRGKDRTLLAGFPWFTDWGRDTFIAMRGLIIAEDTLRGRENPERLGGNRQRGHASQQVRRCRQKYTRVQLGRCVALVRHRDRRNSSTPRLARATPWRRQRKGDYLRRSRPYCRGIQQGHATASR